MRSCRFVSCIAWMRLDAAPAVSCKARARGATGIGEASKPLQELWCIASGPET